MERDFGTATLLFVSQFSTKASAAFGVVGSRQGVASCGAGSSLLLPCVPAFIQHVHGRNLQHPGQHDMC